MCAGERRLAAAARHAATVGGATSNNGRRREDGGFGDDALAEVEAGDEAARSQMWRPVERRRVRKGSRWRQGEGQRRRVAAVVRDAPEHTRNERKKKTVCGEDGSGKR
jgi:hypothetical protein